MKEIEIKRGDIVFVENPNKKPHGHVVCGNHPAVVIQNNKGNEHSTNIIVAFITCYKCLYILLPLLQLLLWLHQKTFLLTYPRLICSHSSAYHFQ